MAQGWRLLQGEEQSIETRWFTLVVGSSKASLIMLLSGPLYLSEVPECTGGGDGAVGCCLGFVVVSF